MKIRRLPPDLTAVLLLVILWLLFFWRLFTPVEADQASIIKGDFSGQFVAFAGYQYQRFANGEVPLWNPYNNGGLPFIGDTQAAVFYPPRLATIALSNLAGGWSYHALELEMTAHILAFSLFMYLLVRRMTLGNPGSMFGAFIASVIASYNGFMTGYAPLQLAILEAGIWLPPALLGVVEVSRNERVHWSWLVLTGFTLGLSWMAGHPQTSWFLTYLLVAFWGYRVYSERRRWTVFVSGTILFGAIAAGIAAVQLLPGIEYLSHTTRTGLGFDAKGNGFPFQDVAQFIFPRVVSVFSPLYVGIIGLIIAIIALWRRLPGSLFWGIVALVALALSFGENSMFYPSLYNVVPGIRFFRGQERAAYLVANSLAILAGLGAAHLVTWDRLQDFKATHRIQQGLLALLLLCGIVTGLVFVSWLGNREAYGAAIVPIAFSTLIAALAAFLIPWLLANLQHHLRLWLLACLMVFELFTVNMDADSNYEPIPPDEQLSMTPPPLVVQALEDSNTPFRVDGFRGLLDNYGSLHAVMDVRGISPLWLDGPFAIIGTEAINPRAWELFAVRYVYSDWQELPIASEIITTGEDRYGLVNLHLLDDPRPFEHLIYNVALVDNDEAAYTLLADTNFNPRQTVILNEDPGIQPDTESDERGTVVSIDFKPEQFTSRVNTPTDAILSVALPHYPGWQVTVDGQPGTILRAYGALSAVAIPAGEHIIQFTYDPLTYRVGAVLSLLTWGAVGILGLIMVIQNRVRHAGD
jgi:hypothetical protein